MGDGTEPANAGERRSRRRLPASAPRNQPAYVADTARLIAAHLGLDPADFAALTTGNFDRLFPKAAK